MSLNQDDTQTKENRGYIGKQLRQMISKTSHYIDENSSSFNFKHKREKKKKKAAPLDTFIIILFLVIKKNGKKEQ